MLGAFVVLPIALVAGDASLLPLIGLLALPLAVKPLRAMSNRTDGPALNAALAGTGALLGAFSLLVSLGLLLAAELHPLRPCRGGQVSCGMLCGDAIASVEVIPYALPFREPYVTAAGQPDAARDGAAAAALRGRPGRVSAKRCRCRCAAETALAQVVAELEQLGERETLDEATLRSDATELSRRRPAARR